VRRPFSLRTKHENNGTQRPMGVTTGEIEDRAYGGRNCFFNLGPSAFVLGEDFSRSVVLDIVYPRDFVGGKSKSCVVPISASVSGRIEGNTGSNSAKYHAFGSGNWQRSVWHESAIYGPLRLELKSL
jgi:hypothetical protein